MEEVGEFMSATNSATKQPNNRPLKESVRWLAMESVQRILFKEAFIHETVSDVLTTHSLSEADRKLLTELIYGTVQHYLTIDALLRQHVKRANRVKKWLWALLLVSLYQHYYLSQIPDYALVDEAVRITKKRGNQSLSRFTNGVLRNVLREVPNLDALYQQFQSLPWEERISQQYSLPKVWVTYFNQRFGKERTEKLAQSFNQRASMTIRISDHAIDRETEIVGALTAEGLNVEASSITPHAYQVTNGTPVHTQAFKNGELTIQDASAQLAAVALDAQPGDKVLDACAAPGGKTVQLAEKVAPNGHVISQDIQENKLNKIDDNIDRMNVAKQVTVKVGDATKLSQTYAKETFDRILIDAPCSGVGLFRRKPDTKYHKSLQDLTSLQAIQKDILNDAVSVLKPGGVLVYSTCTITNEENQAVVEQLLDNHPELMITSISGRQQLLDQAQTSQGTIEILPDMFQSDGFFIARFEKEN